MSDIPVSPSASAPDFLQGGGKMGELIRALDWSKTPLGPVDGWPQSLRTTVSLCLSSTFPILIAWGPERVQIYNDTYRPICGDKHPASMGQEFNVCWASALPAVGHVLDRAQGGQGSYIENLRMMLDRNGYLEEAFMTFSFSPIRDESGGVGGLFHPITETTDKMLAQRRTEILNALATTVAKTTSIAQLGEALGQGYEAASLDVPFLLLYEYEAGSEGTAARLRGQAGCVEPPPASAWPLHEMYKEPATRVLDEVGGRVGALTASPYPEPVAQAVMLPIQLPGATTPMGFLMAGVSTRRALDGAYRAFYEQLGQTIASAIATLHAYEQEQARAAALAELDRAKTAFFSNVSHEFRTPLTLMIGPLDGILAQHELTPDVRAELERVQRNGTRLLKLVNSLLDFSRLEAGRADAIYEPTDVAALSADLASTFRSLLEKAGLELRVEAPALIEPVWVDRSLFEKIVLNLLSNAFKFTFAGSITLKVGARDDGVEISVTDTGTGIAEENLPRLFERFHRVQGAKGRSFEGSGIGLALVQELAKIHGGEVGVTSVLGQGTTFRVWLPFGTDHLPKDRLATKRTQQPTGIAAHAFVDEAAQWTGLAPSSSSQAPAPTTPTRTTTDSPFRGARILLADDNADMRDYVKRLLDSRFDVVTVADGQAALDAARAHPPDLVLSDVMMPQLDGFGLLAALRGDARTAQIPVVLLSARAGEESTVEGLAAGASDYLVKPFSAPELLARIEGNLRTSQARQDLDAFAGRIAHDLRNLLAPLPLVAGQMKMGDDRSKKLGERLERLTRRAGNLLDGMLAFSRAGAATLDGESSSLAGVVADVVEDLETLRKAVNAEIDMVDVDGVLVAAPRGLLYVVALNLVQNALKFMAQSPERRVTLSARVLGEWCELRVADTGPGIAPEARAHVFEPFYRASGAKQAGHGIGLATVQRVVSAVGGDVTVTSTVGSGATFVVRLPHTPTGHSMPVPDGHAPVPDRHASPLLREN